MSRIGYKIMFSTSDKYEASDERVFIYDGDHTFTEITFMEPCEISGEIVNPSDDDDMIGIIVDDATKIVFEAFVEFDYDNHVSILKHCPCEVFKNRPVCRGDVYNYQIPNTPYRIKLEYESDIDKKHGQTWVYKNSLPFFGIPSISVLYASSLFDKFCIDREYIESAFKDYPGPIIWGEDCK